MNLNSQHSFSPPQPDNPTDEQRHILLQNALSQKGWAQDMQSILKLMRPPPDITRITQPGRFKGLRVGILGGGLAGLSAAYELRKMGFDITVFDALTDRVGGRVYTYYPYGDRSISNEFGPMRIPVSHETVWHYIKLFNLPTRPFIQFSPFSLVYLKKMRVRNDAEGQNVKTHIYPKFQMSRWEREQSWQTLLALGTDSHLQQASSAERAEILQVKQCYSRTARYWIDRTNLELMKTAGLTPGAIELTANFLPLLYGNLYSSFIDYIQESYPADLSYLYAIDGGMSHLPEAFYRSFFHDSLPGTSQADCLGRVSYKSGCLVRSLTLWDGGKTVRIGLQDTQSHEISAELFDFIICTLPFSTLRNLQLDPLFSDVKMRAIREVYYTPSQKTLLACRERFWERQGIVGGGSITDLPINSIWYPSDHARQIRSTSDITRLPAHEPGVIIGSFNFGLDTTRLLNQAPEFTSTEVLREIAEVHGLPQGCLEETIMDMKWINWNQEPTFRGAISFFSPAQKRLFAYGMTLPEYNSRVFFAGEHISAVHRWMQGALQTGMQAANDLVTTLK